MKILKRKESNIVVVSMTTCSDENESTTTTAIKCDDTIFGDCTYENCDVIDDVILPPKFVGGCYTYVDGVWDCFNKKQVELVFPVSTITMRQARLGLLAKGLLDDVEAHVATMSKASQIEWEYAGEVRLDYPLVLELGLLLNLPEGEMAAFFEFAKLL